MPLRISVVVPALNEAVNLPRCLASLEPLAPAETIVVDGGSDDATVAVAQALGAQVLAAPRGRAVQLNVGAAVATGDVLLFLHADCRLPVNAREAIERMLADPRIGCGAFRHRIESPRWSLRVIAAADNLRARWLQRPYGDQGLFVRRELFTQVGGYPAVPLLEDVQILQRLRQVTRFALAEAVIETDARRWERLGVTRTTLRNWTILAGAACGVSPERLARLYYASPK